MFLCWFRFVRNLRTNKEGWIPAANLLTLIGESKSSQSLSSSGNTTSHVSSTTLQIPVMKSSFHEWVFSHRRQWVWKPQHILQLQRNLHKLLRHQSLKPLLQRLVAAPTQCTFYWSSSSLCTVFNLVTRERNWSLRWICAIQDILYRASHFLNLLSFIRERKNVIKCLLFPMEILLYFESISVMLFVSRLHPFPQRLKEKRALGRVGINIRAACGFKSL